MMYLLGTDEAGYGPNIGPLVIGASLWCVHSNSTDNVDLYETLSAVVSDTAKDRTQRLAIADSKKLYSSGDSLALLERGVFAALDCLQRPVATRSELFQALGTPWRNTLPWQAGIEQKLPRYVSREQCTLNGSALQVGCDAAQVELLDLRSVVLHADEFNARCEQLGNKAAVLSAATLTLVREIIAQQKNAPMRIVCDKHGGRNSYAALVMEEIVQFDTGGTMPMLQTICEGRAASAYRWQVGEHVREIWFMAKGERFLPAALASMVAKYVRELAMQVWNEFWQQHLPGLLPTAGYPVDALRFRQAIEPLTQQWEWETSLWWRMR
jgi:ribonuclease HII